ncbi:MAG: hypothetical protein N3A02_02795, partial [Rectinema sp.]|nr:hypothetical protein [Rectinema sp.]
PEAPMFLLFSLGMLLSERGHLYKALAMAACAAVLHPTGLIGFGIFGIGSIVTLVRKRQLPSFSDTACWVIPLAMWIYFLQLILRHWNDFFESWYATYSEPMTQSLYSIITNKWLLLVVLPVVVVTITAFVVRRSWVFPSLILVGISLIPVIRTQMWYEVYKSWTLGMLSAMGFSLTSEILRDRFRIPNIMAMSVSLLAVLPILYFSYRHGWLEGPRGYPRDMTWGWGMIVEDPAIPYFTREDEEKILTALRTHTLSQGGRLMVRPDAEALLYRHTFEPLQVYQPVRASVMPDWVLFRRSRYIPPWVRDAHLSGITNSFELAAILHARNETEEWTLWRRKVP